MAGLERITCTFHENDFLTVPPRTTADLPPHVLGTARWNSNWNRYYVPRVFTTTNRPEPVEFLNNRWYLLHVDSTRPGVFFTNTSSLIAITNNLGLGYWDPSDPQHPDYQPTSAIDADPPSPTQNPLPSSSSATVQPTPIALLPAVVPPAPVPVPAHQTPVVLPPAVLGMTKSNRAPHDRRAQILVARIAFLAFWWNDKTPSFETLVCNTRIVHVCVVKIKMGYGHPWLRKQPSLVYPWYQCACQCLRSVVCPRYLSQPE